MYGLRRFQCAQACAGKCGGPLWCQLLSLLHWDTVQQERQPLLLALHDAVVSYPAEESCASPVASPRGAHVFNIHLLSPLHAASVAGCRLQPALFGWPVWLLVLMCVRTLMVLGSHACAVQTAMSGGRGCHAHPVFYGFSSFATEAGGAALAAEVAQALSSIATQPLLGDNAAVVSL